MVEKTCCHAVKALIAKKEHKAHPKAEKQLLSSSSFLKKSKKKKEAKNAPLPTSKAPRVSPRRTGGEGGSSVPGAPRPAEMKWSI